MYTQCRSCGELFQVAVDDLVTAAGMVRCSSCGAVFNALGTLSDYKPQGGSDLILNENDNPPPLLNHEFKQSVVEKSTRATQKILLNDQLNTFDKEEIDECGEFEEKPDFVVETRVDKPKSSVMFWALLSIILLSCIVWQASLGLQNGSLNLPVSKLKDLACSKINCFVSREQTNLNKIALVSRSIRKHPGRDNALIIKTGIINSDENIQSYPALKIKMSNLNGEIVAMRRFLPSEYLDEEILNAGMIPNTLIPVTLELQSPGENAVTFEVGFSPTLGEK